MSIYIKAKLKKSGEHTKRDKYKVTRLYYFEIEYDIYRNPHARFWNWKGNSNMPNLTIRGSCDGPTLNIENLCYPTELGPDHVDWPITIIMPLFSRQITHITRFCTCVWVYVWVFVWVWGCMCECMFLGVVVCVYVCVSVCVFVISFAKSFCPIILGRRTGIAVLGLPKTSKTYLPISILF